MMRRPSRKKPPYTHREIAEAYLKVMRMLRRLESRSEFEWLPDLVKIDLYFLFMTLLPNLITFLVWIAIGLGAYWYLT